LGRKRGTDVFRARSAEHPDDESWPGLLIVRVVGRAFFLNAQGIGDRLWPLVDEMRPTVLLLDGSAVIDVEYTALKMLIEAEERLHRQGVTLWVASLNADVLKVVQQSPLGRTLGRGRMFFNLQGAVQHYELTIASAPVAHGTRSVENDPTRATP
jgi:MFS superfamily sulfate permease-like transporter